MDVLSVPVRDYPYGKLAAHAIGYLNEISAEELGANADQRLPRGRHDRPQRHRARLGELTCAAGAAIKRVYVDARGRRSRIKPRARLSRRCWKSRCPAATCTLTLDMELMRMLERAFRGQPSGAAVVVDVRTGKVRALFSKPAYDLNEMSGKLSVERAARAHREPVPAADRQDALRHLLPGLHVQADQRAGRARRRHHRRQAQRSTATASTSSATGASAASTCTARSTCATR